MHLGLAGALGKASQTQTHRNTPPLSDDYPELAPIANHVQESCHSCSKQWTDQLRDAAIKVQVFAYIVRWREHMPMTANIGDVGRIRAARRIRIPAGSPIGMPYAEYLSHSLLPRPMRQEHSRRHANFDNNIFAPPGYHRMH
jgi:hypothetical protein